MAQFSLAPTATVIPPLSFPAESGNKCTVSRESIDEFRGLAHVIPDHLRMCFNQNDHPHISMKWSARYHFILSRWVPCPCFTRSICHRNQTPSCNSPIQCTQPCSYHRTVPQPQESSGTLCGSTCNPHSDTPQPGTSAAKNPRTSCIAPGTPCTTIHSTNTPWSPDLRECIDCNSRRRWG